MAEKRKKNSVLKIRECPRLTAGSYSLKNQNAKIIHVMPHADKNNQTTLIRAEIREHADHFIPGQFVQARVALPKKGKKARWHIAASALVRNGSQSYIFLEKQTGFRPVHVAVVSQEADRLIVQSDGIKGDERVVTKGVSVLKSAWLNPGE